MGWSAMSQPPLPTAVLLSFLVITTALAGNRVTQLPGFPGPLPFELETGYEYVEDVELFYYFFPSESNPVEDPLVFWLTGGPGCSGLNPLAIEKIGPIGFARENYDGNSPSLVYNPYSWTKVANFIFIDSPVGAGFSFSKFAEAYEVDDEITVRQLYEFLIKWYDHHPYFLSNPLYIGGDSYAGKLAPILTHEISIGVEIPMFRNLKGYIVGNPVTGDLIDSNSKVRAAHRMGIISDELYRVIEENCRGDYWNPDAQNVACFKAMSEFKQLYDEVNPSYILDPSLETCPIASRKQEPMDLSDGRRSLHEEPAQYLQAPEVPDFKCRSYLHYLAYYWANNDSSREALHVKKGSVREWVRCNDTIFRKSVGKIPSSLKYHQSLMQKGYRVLIYSGDLDLEIPYVGTLSWMKSFDLAILDDWRSWHVDGEVAGYTRKFVGDVTFATVKNAGHTAPEYQTKTCWCMFQRWISHKQL